MRRFVGREAEKPLLKRTDIFEVKDRERKSKEKTVNGLFRDTQYATPESWKKEIENDTLGSIDQYSPFDFYRYILAGQPEGSAQELCLLHIAYDMDTRLAQEMEDMMFANVFGSQPITTQYLKLVSKNLGKELGPLPGVDYSNLVRARRKHPIVAEVFPHNDLMEKLVLLSMFQIENAKAHEAIEDLSATRAVLFNIVAALPEATGHKGKVRDLQESLRSLIDEAKESLRRGQWKNEMPERFSSMFENKMKRPKLPEATLAEILDAFYPGHGNDTFDEFYDFLEKDLEASNMTGSDEDLIQVLITPVIFVAIFIMIFSVSFNKKGSGYEVFWVILQTIFLAFVSGAVSTRNILSVLWDLFVSVLGVSSAGAGKVTSSAVEVAARLVDEAAETVQVIPYAKNVLEYTASGLRYFSGGVSRGSDVISKSVTGMWLEYLWVPDFNKLREFRSTVDYFSSSTKNTLQGVSVVLSVARNLPSAVSISISSTAAHFLLPALSSWSYPTVPLATALVYAALSWYKSQRTRSSVSTTRESSSLDVINFVPNLDSQLNTVADDADKILKDFTSMSVSRDTMLSVMRQFCLTVFFASVLGTPSAYATATTTIQLVDKFRLFQHLADRVSISGYTIPLNNLLGAVPTAVLVSPFGQIFELIDAHYKFSQVNKIGRQWISVMNELGLQPHAVETSATNENQLKKFTDELGSLVPFLRVVSKPNENFASEETLLNLVTSFVTLKYKIDARKKEKESGQMFSRLAVAFKSSVDRQGFKKTVTLYNRTTLLEKVLTALKRPFRFVVTLDDKILDVVNKTSVERRDYWNELEPASIVKRVVETWKSRYQDSLYELNQGSVHQVDKHFSCYKIAFEDSKEGAEDVQNIIADILRYVFKDRLGAMVSGRVSGESYDRRQGYMAVHMLEALLRDFVVFQWLKMKQTKDLPAVVSDAAKAYTIKNIDDWTYTDLQKKLQKIHDLVLKARVDQGIGSYRDKSDYLLLVDAKECYGLCIQA